MGNFRMKSACFSVIRRRTFAGLLKIKRWAANASAAGRYTEMRMRRKNSLQDIKNVPIFIVRCLQKADRLNGLPLPFDRLFPNGGGCTTGGKEPKFSGAESAMQKHGLNACSAPVRKIACVMRSLRFFEQYSTPVSGCLPLRQKRPETAWRRREKRFG